jgi:hypothetical protein
MRADPAVTALGWTGLAVPGVALLGTRVTLVVSVDAAAHAARADAGAGPMLDIDTLAIWEWPESAAPPPVVALVGALIGTPVGAPAAPATWRRAAAAGRRWAPFTATAIHLAGPASPLCRLECGYAGIAVVVGPDLVLPGRAGRAWGARRRALDRWVEEWVYRRLLSDGVLTASQAGRNAGAVAAPDPASISV